MEKLVSRCQLLCLSRWFSFAHARILYQRGLIRIKCLKAFQTPGDVDNFWLDLQTKQTIMMQACVKMYTAVEQQMPALHVFINVFSSAVRQPRRNPSAGATTPPAHAEVQRKGPSTEKQWREKKERCCSSVLVLRAQISPGRPKRIVSAQDVIKKKRKKNSNIPAVVQKRCIFWDATISRPPLLLLQERRRQRRH